MPEMNLGQLSRLVRAEFLVDARSVTKVQGVPFTAGELEAAILDTLGGLAMTDLDPRHHAARTGSSDQEVRWCPGCGDYSILAAVQLLMPDLGVRRENTVFVSGIGCAARFPYYMNTYGMHSIHGRAPGHRHRPGHGPARPRRVGGHAATATRCRSAATTSSTRCAATSTSRS